MEHEAEGRSTGARSGMRIASTGSLRQYKRRKFESLRLRSIPLASGGPFFLWPDRILFASRHTDVSERD